MFERSDASCLSPLLVQAPEDRTPVDVITGGVGMGPAGISASPTRRFEEPPRLQWEDEDEDDFEYDEDEEFDDDDEEDDDDYDDDFDDEDDEYYDEDEEYEEEEDYYEDED